MLILFESGHLAQYRTDASFLGKGSQIMQKLPSPLLHSHNFGHSHPLLKITHLQSVRFQKEMRPVSLEIPEPGETKYQNQVRRNPK